ncbi:MAG: carboxypeptidase regulatory-like domain-containing protein [Planctomycetes bacterium]|nr:carboxypeptidase regulatory-like domain-containing protein [Planctomycetota bacterium]
MPRSFSWKTPVWIVALVGTVLLFWPWGREWLGVASKRRATSARGRIVHDVGSSRSPAVVESLAAASGEAAPESDARLSTGSPDRGGLRPLTEADFVNRLRELGIRDVREFFDESESDPDRGSVAVLVLDTEEMRLDAADVTLDPANESESRAGVRDDVHSPGALHARSSRDGFVRFAAVSPKRYLVTVERTEYTPRFLAGIEVRAGEETFLEVRLEPSSESITGIVEDPAGRPIAGARVSAERFIEGGAPVRSTTGSDIAGAFVLHVLEGSSNTLRAEKPGYTESILQHVIAGSASCALILEPTETVEISGFVTEGISETPVRDFTIDGQPISSSSGRFAVERSVLETPQQLEIGAEGFVPRVAPYSTSAGHDIDLGRIALFREAGLYGVVLLERDGARDPLGGVTVNAQCGGVSHSASTTADGGFAFVTLTGASAELTILAPGVAEYHRVVELSSDDATFVEVVLVPGEYELNGTVVERESGAPLPGTIVELVDHPEHATLTEADGSYRIANIPFAEVRARARRTGYFSAQSEAMTFGEEAPSQTWDAELRIGGVGARLSSGGLSLGEGVEVVLWRRVDADLASLSSAQASLDANRWTATTDVDGYVAFEVPDGDYFLQVPTYRLDPSPISADATDPEWLEIDVPGRTTLSGRITDAAGQPVANTSLWLHSGDQDYSTMFLYHTDDDGRYQIPALAPQRYALSILKSVADQSAQHVREVQIAGAAEQTFDVQFPPLTGSISGRLVDENGLGKPGVWIGVEYLDAPHRSILAGWVGTDGDGYYHVPRLEPGHHLVRTAWTDDEVVFSEVIPLGIDEEREVNLVAPRIEGHHVQGQMIGPDGGPIGGSFVFAVDAQGRQSGNFFSTMDWAYLGAFDVKGLKPGNYTLIFTAMGCVPRSVPVTVAGDTSGLLVTMSRE